MYLDTACSDSSVCPSPHPGRASLRWLEGGCCTDDSSSGCLSHRWHCRLSTWTTGKSHHELPRKHRPEHQLWLNRRLDARFCDRQAAAMQWSLELLKVAFRGSPCTSNEPAAMAEEVTGLPGRSHPASCRGCWESRRPCSPHSLHFLGFNSFFKATHGY